MNVVDLLKDGACLDLLVDAAAANNYGGLITASELRLALDDECEESAAVLKKVLDPLDDDLVVAKCYAKGQNIKVIGLSVHALMGGFGLFGQALPKGVSLSKTKEKRGSGDREYSAPIARLSIKGADEDEVISLDFDFAKPADAENYTEWCSNACAMSRADLVENGLLGEYSEPALNPNMGQERVNLQDIPPGKYQVTALDWEERQSKAGNPYKVWSLGVTAADREFVTWQRVLPKCMEVGAVQQRMLATGKLLVLDVKGLRDQLDKFGNKKPDNDGGFYQELNAKIYAVDALPTLSPMEVIEVAPTAKEKAKAKSRTSAPTAPEIEDDEMPF